MLLVLGETMTLANGTVVARAGACGCEPPWLAAAVTRGWGEAGGGAVRAALGRGVGALPYGQLKQNSTLLLD